MLADKLRRAGGSAGGLFVDDLFSTYLYTGNGSTQTITNGIDLAGEGGMVWIKNRDDGGISHVVQDTARGADTIDSRLSTDTASSASTGYFQSYDTDGFTLKGTGGASYNQSSVNYTSWTFRKAPKFFDVVTYTGDGVAGRTVAHNLGSVPACIIIKAYSGGFSGSQNWPVYHRSLLNTETLLLNTADPKASVGSGYWNSATPTSTEFSLGAANAVNVIGGTYVAYLFAHNDGDGNFGENGDEDIIKCGSFSGNTSVTLGFEPQYLKYKRTDSTGNWVVLDMMRGLIVSGNDAELYPNLSSAETTSASDYITPTATGFTTTNLTGDYIYIAIRRPHKPAESGSEVFAVDEGDGVSNSPAFNSGFPVDMAFFNYVDGVGNTEITSRLTQGKRLFTNLTNAETDGTNNNFDSMVGWKFTALSTGTYSWMFKRSKGFFDVVCYTGDGIAGRTVNHNLGVVPELMIVKNRNNATAGWLVYHFALGATDYIFVNLDIGANSSASAWNNTQPDSSILTVGSGGESNEAMSQHLAYLFATQAGISKVGSYTGNGTSQTIDCGFSTGARFFLVKATSTTGSWWVFDSARGIVSSFDPALQLNSTAAEITTADAVDPVASGIIVNQEATCSINASGVAYVFLAVA